MQRRTFMTWLGSAASWPLSVQAQQTAMPVIGLLDLRSPNASAGRLDAFRLGLKDTGFVEGENVVIAYRWAQNQAARVPELVADLVRREVAVIATAGDSVPMVVKAATTTIPIVFIMGQDPVGLGLVASLARPGGNLTGVNFISAELTAKRLELLRELVPGTARIAVLVNPADAAITESTLRDVESAARALGLQIQVLNASTSQEIDAAFAMVLRERLDALLVGGSPFFTAQRDQLVDLASRNALPTVYAQRDFAEIGGLMSYATNITDAWRQAGAYAGRILKGAKPADLPVVQATRFELVINLKTARALGLAVPAILLSQANEVIE